MIGSCQVLTGDEKILAGNWYAFPPPAPGFYDIRKVRTQHNVAQTLEYVYYANRRVYVGSQKRLMCMNHRVTRMRPEDGWQFRFQQQYDRGVPVNWRPMAVIYDFSKPTAPRVIEKRDISQQLPFARSREEALHIVRLIPERWPIYRKIHVEYTEERLQS